MCMLCQYTIEPVIVETAKPVVHNFMIIGVAVGAGFLKFMQVWLKKLSKGP